MEPATCWVDALREVVPERVGWVTLPVPFHLWCPPWGLPVDCDGSGAIRTPVWHPERGYPQAEAVGLRPMWNSSLTGS